MVVHLVAGMVAQSELLQHEELAMQLAPHALYWLLQVQACADEQVAFAWHSLVAQHAVVAMHVPLQSLVPDGQTHFAPLQTMPFWHSVDAQQPSDGMQPLLHFL